MARPNQVYNDELKLVAKAFKTKIKHNHDCDYVEIVVNGCRITFDSYIDIFNRCSHNQGWGAKKNETKD